MYMRIVRAQPAQGQADEVARKWAAFWPERMRAQPGFRHAHFGIDRATGAIAGVTVFDREAGRRGSQSALGGVPGNPRGERPRPAAGDHALRDRRRGLRPGERATSIADTPSQEQATEVSRR